LVNPGAVTLGAPTVGAPKQTSDAPTVGAPNVTLGAPPEGTLGAPRLGAPLRNKKEVLRTTTSSTAAEGSPAIVTALRRATGRSDDDAAILIANACRTNTPNITDAEICHFIDDWAKTLRSMKNIDNPMGFLIVRVPSSCKGESLRQYREEEARKRAELQQLAREILASSGSTPENVDWARQMLGFVDCIDTDVEHGEENT
jgi:hypothetical protein